MDEVGFIGVGAMGFPIVRRLIAQNIRVQAYDLDPAALAAAADTGADVATSAREVANRNAIVFSCLPTADICRAVALGPDGVAGGAKVRIYVETSTIGGAAAEDLSRELAAHAITLLDCPVVGGTVALEAGTLGVLVSGPEAAYAQAQAALDAFAGRLFYLGGRPGAAQAAKVMNNAVAYAAFLATCEAVATGMKAGLDMKTAVAIINQGSGRNFFSEQVFPNFMVQGRYEGTGAMEIGVKDVRLFLEEALRLHVETPMASHVSALQQEVLKAGSANRDTMTAFHYFSDLAGLSRPA